VLSTLPLPALVNMTDTAAAGQGDRACREAALSQPEADLHRAQAPADDRLPLGLPARRAVSRQPPVGAEERQRRHGAARSHLLCIELSLWKDEPLWQASDKESTSCATRPDEDGLRRHRGEVEAYHVTDIPTAYPVYELNFEDHLIPVLDGVHEMPRDDARPHRAVLNNSMDDNVRPWVPDRGSHRSAGRDGRVWVREMLQFMKLRFAVK
jgi:hypothetical protein